MTDWQRIAALAHGEITLEPMFGPKPGWEPTRQCAHIGEFPRHSRLCCMVCHHTGLIAQRRIGPPDEPRDPESTKPAKHRARVGGRTVSV